MPGSWRDVADRLRELRESGATVEQVEKAASRELDTLLADSD